MICSSARGKHGIYVFTGFPFGHNFNAVIGQIRGELNSYKKNILNLQVNGNIIFFYEKMRI